MPRCLHPPSLQQLFVRRSWTTLFTVTLLIVSHLRGTAGRPLNAIQLAVGEWEVSMRAGCWLDVSRIFPPAIGEDVGRGRQMRASSLSLPSPCQVKRRPWGSSLKCRLSLASDGSFVLVPKTLNAKSAYRVLPVRGRWSLLANPYCVTDRFYDTLSLVSYPREKVVGRGNSNLGNNNHILQTVQLNLNCRLWGIHERQDGGVLRRVGRISREIQQPQKSQRIETAKEIPATPSSTAVGRMTHGTLVWKELLPPSSPLWRRLKPRPILASFSAKRCSREPAHEGWFDIEQYGY